MSTEQNDIDSNKKLSVGSWAAEHKAIIFAALIGAFSTLLAAYIARPSSTESSPVSDSFSESYFLNYSFYNVLLEGFASVRDAEIDAEEKSIVKVGRIDSIVKNKNSTEDYSLPFYTTGKRMEVDTLKSSVTASFSEVKNDDDKYRHSYELNLPIGKSPKGHNEVMHNRFTFINGFRDSHQESWVSSIKYSTKAVGVHIQCPSFKPCKSVKVFRRRGFSAPSEIADNPAFLSEDGIHILWMGNEERPDTRIMFIWTW